MSRMRRALQALMARFGLDDRGVSAVEFALLAPVMIFFYFGLAEACQAYMAQKRAGHVNAMVGDLIAQNEAIDGDGVDETFAISGLIMRPFPDDGLRQRVTSVTVKDGVTEVVWSHAQGMDALEADEAVTIPDGLITEGQTLIMTEIEYDYDSPVDYLLPQGITFDFQSYLRPRRSDAILYTP